MTNTPSLHETEEFPRKQNVSAKTEKVPGKPTELVPINRVLFGAVISKDDWG